MIPLLVVAAGVVALVAGLVVVRSFGRAGRIGRALAGARPMSLPEAAALAGRSSPPYVRVTGRIDAEKEFEDEHHRPLVLRTTVLEVETDGRWERVSDSREVVPFTIRDGPDEIDIDLDAIADGLVVMPREAVGRASEVPGRIPPGTDQDARVRYVVQQVSSIEHAIVAGVPTSGSDGRAMMTAGRGRPLILTTLELDEAYRLLGGGRRGRSGLALGLLLGGGVAIAVGVAWAFLAAAAAMAASPTPAAGDPRSSGEGPGLAGEPVLAIVGVLVIGLVTIAATWAWVRWADRRTAGGR